MERTLVFTTCYNERDNVGSLVDRIVEAVPAASILVVDDNSPDGTWDVLLERQRKYPQLACVKRPRKLGIGSAHKYALRYAMREGFDTLVTMDADFSHDPAAIPSLLAAHGRGAFVTGSRYCPGGRSDYTGYRAAVSRLGNMLARRVLGVRLRELTTYFRVFDVATLRRLPLRTVVSHGYSYGVQVVGCLDRAGVELREVPIHFVDRTHGASKIPRMQIVYSALDLARMALHRIIGRSPDAPDIACDDACAVCGDRALMEQYRGSGATDPEDTSPASASYRCTAAGTHRTLPVYMCLRCGVAQIPAGKVPSDLEALYADVEDPGYLANAPVREITFARLLDRLAQWMPAKPGRLLDVGAYCGLFLAEAGRRGWQGTGVEPSRWAAAEARRRGQRVLDGTLAQAGEALSPPYDVVTSWDVLEHVRDPGRMIAECAAAVAPGGILCLSTLDASARFARWMGKRWPWMIDMHLVYFDRRTVIDMLSQHGLEFVADFPYQHYTRIDYALRALAGSLPAPLASGLRGLASVSPSWPPIPVALGDVRVFVARKR